MADIALILDPLDVGLVNCADCYAELVGPRTAQLFLMGYSCAEYDEAPRVAGNILGRPYCNACLAPHKPPSGSYGPLEDGSPWQQNAVRVLEDGGHD